MKFVTNPVNGLKVLPAPKWRWGSQARGAAYGVIMTCDSTHSKVAWKDSKGWNLAIHQYRTGEGGDLIHFSDEDEIMPDTSKKTDGKYYPKNRSSEPAAKSVEKVVPVKDETLSTFTVVIPEHMVEAHVSKKVEDFVNNDYFEIVVADVAEKHLPKVVAKYTEKAEAVVLDKMMKMGDEIINAYLEKNTVQIFLRDELKATIPAGGHKLLPTLVKYLHLFKQALIVGPTGSGKSTMAFDAAKAMGLRYSAFSCNMEASKSELVGFYNLHGYVGSQFLDFYENGGVFLIDEYDAMSASIAVVLNAVFDRTDQISVPNRDTNPIAKKHKDFYCILAGNTWGSGSIEYQGREPQDMAFLDRFKLCRLEIDYDVNLEKGISPDHYPWFQKIREFMAKHNNSEKFSTRSVYDATLLMQNGFTRSDILTMVAQHWERELKSKLFSIVGTS